MYSLLVLLAFPLLVSAAPPLGKCASYPKLAALDWAHQIFESDIETAKALGTEALTLDIKPPVLAAKDKNPAGVSEVYALDWKLRYKGKTINYTASYFYDENCHRMKNAEFKAGQGSEVKAQ